MKTKVLQTVTNVWKYAASVALLFILGVGNAWGFGHDTHTATLKVAKGTGNGSVYASTSDRAQSGSASASFNCGGNEGGQHTGTLYAYATPADGYTFLGWTTSKTSSEGADNANPKGVAFDVSSGNSTKTLYAHFVEKAKVNITFIAPSNGTYTIKVDGGSVETVSSSNVVKNNVMGVTLTATPASGYAFAGWYKLNSSGSFVDDISIDSPYDASFTVSETIQIGARFVPTTLGKFILKGGNTQYYGLKAATIAAGGSGVIVPVAEETVVDGSDLMPFDNGTYTIKAGATLLVPYSSANEVQTKPKDIAYNTTGLTTALSIYKKLITRNGANINIMSGGVLCVGGQLVSYNGGNPSAYPIGACGVLDMSAGGHIELYGTIYCWGFIKGQDMDQGNNTTEVGTITANNGSVIWEDFAVGDWRGGTACSTIAGNASSWKFFPFQSYTIQNVEVPTTYHYGATLSNYTNVYGGGGKNEGTFSLIGKSNTLFQLKDASSSVCKWYDPTTDLVNYEMRGTAQLDALNVDAGITTVSSSSYNLPLSSNMQIVLAAGCNMTLSKPMVVQPGAVVEVKSGASLTLSSNTYIFDVDNWGMYCYGRYFYSMTILTSHKNRGTGKSKDLLDDAKLIVDGTLNVTGKIYATDGGANIMGNGAGAISLSSLGSNGNIVMCTGVSTNENVAIAQANLHNEDESYTKAIASTTFHNVHGRWFAASAKDEKANHTYNFTYISSGAVSGTGGSTTTTDAVYSNDKTGLEARMKWFNVTADCNESGHYWWHGQGDQTTWFYNWTLNSAWHQFLPTATTGLYSCSNNTLYTKSDCTWEELGSTDVNCLYTIGGEKKALVDGQFIELEANSDDPAYHEKGAPTNYYICFEGCNWHAATKYPDEKKAYVVDETTFIWFEDNWMAVEREEPFFYTKDETNVTIYYEYIGSEWVLAQPYVEVTDATETRQLLRFNEAIAVASLQKNATIKLLRDLVNVTTPMTFTGANTTCTLDLNGHVAEVHVVAVGNDKNNIPKMLTLNGASTTFTIVDNTTDKKGELKLIASTSTTTNTQRWSGIYVQNGSLVLQSGKVYVEHPFAWVTNSNTGFIRGILVASAKTFTMNGGTLEVVSDYNTYGIESASGTPTVNINHGTIECIATKKDSPYGIIGYGTINIKNDSYIHANAKASSSSRGVSVSAGSSYQGTVNVTGGTIYSEATSSAQGIYCGGTAVVTGDYNATTPNNTPKNRYYAKANISGGTITAVCRTSTSSYGVLSYGTTTISGGTITSTVQKSNQNTAYGVCASGGTTTIQNGANITANAPTIAYGVTVTGANGDSNRGWPHVGVVNITGGTITANTTNTTTAYGLLVTGTTWTINKTNDYKVFNGDYAAAGTATVTGGTFNANAKTTLSRGIVVAATKTKNEASATPTCTINGGYYQMTGTGDVLGCNASALAADFHINGGYYSHDGNLATYAASPKHVLTLASGDANRPPYYYKVAEAYLVTFKTEDGSANIIDPVYQEVGTKPVCSTEPTKASTSTNSFTFDGWATSANGAKVYEKNGLPNVTSAGATYYAHFATTTLKYRVHLDATTNGGECATENIFVEPGNAVSTAITSLPTASKYGYTFSGWYTTAASGGTQLALSTVINADVEYYARFTVNSHTLTWDLAGGKVSTAGKIGSTTWPAKNATGTPSTSVAYGTVLTTIPVVTKAGYVFNRWDPVPTSSMPDNDVTFTALWNPATNTAYTVKHLLQDLNCAGYTEVTEDRQSLTGTTGATVTPEPKSYDGFITPAKQSVTIAADGSSVLEYRYNRVEYTINWNAYTNGGTCATTSTNVIHGNALGASMPSATKPGQFLDGWYTQPVGGVKITAETAILQNYGTLYAQFVDLPSFTWTITVNNAEYGSVSQASIPNVPYGAEVTENGNQFTVYGVTVTATPKSQTTQYNYTFSSWSNLPETVTDAVEIQAVFTRTTRSYDVTFNMQGHGSAITKQTIAYNGTVAEPTPAPTDAAYDFGGWYKEAACSNAWKFASDKVTGTTVLYAKWTIKKYTITYNPGANGSGTIASGEKTHDVAFTLSSSKFTRTGYTQTGWSTEDGGTKTYNLGGSYTTNASIMLYPFWTINTYTVTWKNGNTTIDTDEGVEYGTVPAYDGATTPTKETDENFGYTFDGWAAADGGEKLASLPAVSDNVTYYAHYSTTPTVASVKVGSAEPTYYADFADAWEATNSATGTVTLKLLKDVEGIATSLAYTNAQNCTLDLNNHTLSGTVTKLIDVNATGTTFTIDDSSTAKGGKISLTKSASSRIYCLYITAGTVNLKHGIIYCKNSSTSTSTTKNNASAVYVAAGQKFTMDDGTVESISRTSSYALYIDKSTTSEVTINGGLIKGHTNSSTTAGGIYNYCTKLTINGGHIIGHAYTSTSYGINQYGKSTINGGIIEATNDTTSSKGTATAYGIFVQYNSSTYNGAITIPSSSTVQVLAKARTNTAYAVYISSGSSSGNTIAGGTYTAIAKTGKTAIGVYSFGTITISGGIFNVSTATTAAYGIYTRNKTTTVSGSPVFNVKSGSTDAYGAFAYGYLNAKGTSKTTGTIKLNGGTFNVTSTTKTAYGAYAGLYGLNIVQKGTTANDTVFGQHYMPGILEITNGTFNVKATTTGAYGIVVAAAKSESGAVGTTARRPKITVSGGKFKAESEDDDNATAYAMNTSATASYLIVQGGQYNTKKTGASTNIENKYTQPTKTSTNYWVLDLPDSELPYKYEVAEAYKVTWDATTNGGSCATSYTIVKKSEAIGILPEASKTGHTFTGWYTNALGGTQINASTTVTKAVTYYAQFTPNTYNITYKDQGDTEFSGTHGANYPTTHTYGTATNLVSPTKTGYTFNGWFANSSCTGAALTTIAATDYTEDFTLYAQWTVNNYDITLHVNDGTINSGNVTSYTYGEGATLPTDVTRDNHTFGGWFDNAELSGDAVTSIGSSEIGAKEFWAKWTINETGPYLDIVDWTATTLTLNANSWPTNGWPYSIIIKNGTPIECDKDARAADRTLTITYDAAADWQLEIVVVKKSGTGDVYSKHSYTVPRVIDTDAEYTGKCESCIYYVHNGATWTVKGETTVKAIFVAPEATLVINKNATLTVDSLVLRTTAWKAAVLENNGTLNAAHAYYTRQVADKAYNQFALPLGVNSTGDVFLSNHANYPYGTAWVLKSYSEASRAEYGTTQSNWVELAANQPIAATTGYELYSGSAYYREFYFPVTIAKTPITQAQVHVQRTNYEEGAGAGDAHEGWNALCSPLLGKAKYQYPDNDPSKMFKPSILYEEGIYQQVAMTEIMPAVPFYYQAPATGTLTFESLTAKAASGAPRRAQNTEVLTQWLQLTINDDSGKKLDETNIFINSDKFDASYEMGYDVAKQSLTGGKALIYTELACGKLAFAAIPDSIAETRIPVTVYAGSDREYTFSMRDNDYLTRLQYVFLHDTETGAVTDLLQSDYICELTQGVAAGRFYIQCVFVQESSSVTTEVDNVSEEPRERLEKAQKILYHDKVYIIYRGRVYDMTGRQCELK